MAKTKTKIEKQLRKKSNNDLVEIIIAAKKNEKWVNVARVLSMPRRNSTEMNLDEINQNAKDGEIIVIPGKVLSGGEINKKIKIVAFGFSEKAREKLLKAKIQTANMLEEIKKNPEAKGIRILKNE